MNPAAFGLRLSVMMAGSLALGCGGGGGSGSDRGSSEGDGGEDDDGGQCPEADDIDCDIDRINAAHYAAPIPGCFGADVDPPPVPNPGEGIGGGDGFVVPGLVDSEATPAQVGVWTEIVDNEGHLPVHSIHRPTGKFLHFGYDSNAGSQGLVEDKSVWIPPEACEDPGSGIENCEVSSDIDPLTPGSQNHLEVFDADPDMTEVSLFCAGHVNLPPAVQDETLYPRTLTVGGSRIENINQSIPGAYVFWEALPNETTADYDWTQVDDLSNYRWYPTATVLADGSIAVPGGTFSNVGSLRCKTTEDGVVLQDEECVCESTVGDFYYDLGICSDGYCVANPEDAVEEDVFDEIGFDPCWTVTDTAFGIEVGERTLPATNPPEFGLS